MPDDERQVAVTATPGDRATYRDLPNQATPEPARRVPGEHGDLPPTRGALQQRARHLCSDPSTPISPQHEELGDLANSRTCEVGGLTNEHEAGGASADAHDVVLTAAPPPECAMPRGRREPAVRLDVPALAAEIVDVELNESTHERDVGAPQRAQRDAGRHAQRPRRSVSGSKRASSRPVLTAADRTSTRTTSLPPTKAS